MKRYFIYELSHNGQSLYIGQTIRPFRRYMRHLMTALYGSGQSDQHWRANPEMYACINRLSAADGIPPTLSILGAVCSEDNKAALAWEQVFITLNQPLFNTRGTGKANKSRDRPMPFAPQLEESAITPIYWKALALIAPLAKQFRIPISGMSKWERGRIRKEIEAKLQAAA